MPSACAFMMVPIYGRCESEVVRINYEAPHSGSLAGDFVPVAVLSVRSPFSRGRMDRLASIHTLGLSMPV